MYIPDWKKILVVALLFMLIATALTIPTLATNEEKETIFSEIISIIRQNFFKQEKDESSEMVEVVLEEPDWDLINTPPEPTLDRTKPLYNVYKDGYAVEVPVELQWYIRDMCETYSFYEKYVYGMILTESTFQPTVSSGGCVGLCQINTFWIKGAAIAHFTDDYRSRDLKDPYDNLLTMTEMWCYARDTYGLDLMTEDGMMGVLYWHNSGNDPRRISKSSYANVCMKYANELVPLQ